MDIFIFITAICAYIIGAIPTGYLIAKLKGIADIRAHGSGNIGATNVSRLFGLHYFFLIFLLDAGKAFFFMYLIKPYFTDSYLFIFAALLLIGNGCSLFLRGNGGKGVATLLGLLAILHTFSIIVLLGLWGILLVITQTVGIASVGAIISLPIYAYTTQNSSFFLFSLFATLWIIRTHRSNIKNYWNNR